MCLFVYYFVAYDRLEEYVRDCIKEERFIEAIVLIHNSIEIYLSSIIADTLDNNEKIKVTQNFKFIDLAKICYILDVIDRTTYFKLQNLNKARNSLAHQDLPSNLTLHELVKKVEEWLDLADYILKIGIKIHDEWQEKHPELKALFDQVINNNS
jgi:hypothetical protein